MIAQHRHAAPEGSRPCSDGPRRYAPAELRAVAPLRRAAVALAVLVGGATLGGCRETVAFLSLDIDAPSWTPAITCEGDPRRPERIAVTVSCDDGNRTETSYELGQSTAVSLSGAALGACRIDVAGANRHGRTVVSASLLTEILIGDNEPLRIELLQEPCGEGCDGDGDGLADADEEALGLDPGHRDSDGDGLDDGLELVRCCSDPKRRGGERCQLLIDKVLPPLGVAGAPVMLKATAELQDPEVTLGGWPLVDPIVDTTTVFGRVNERAVLGPVTLASGGAEQAHSALFAVLRGPPEPIYEIDQKAGATAGLLQELVDLRTTASATYLLGTPAPAGPASPSAADQTAAVLVVLDRQASQYRRAVLPAEGSPRSLALGEDRLGVVLRRESAGTLVTFAADPTSDGGVKAETYALDDAPVAAAFQLGTEGVLILNDSSVTRVDLASGAKRKVGVPEALGKLQLPLVDDSGRVIKVLRDRLAVRCSGIALAIEIDQLFISCNVQAPCGEGDAAGDCPAAPGRGVLLRFGPLAKCFGSNTDAASAAGCWAVHAAPGPDRIYGPPVVDRQAKRVYALTGAGVAAMPLAAQALGILAPVIPFSLDGLLPRLPRHDARVMVADPAGRLYVAAGPRVHRFEPRAAEVGARYGRPFAAGQEEGQSAQLLSIDPLGTILDVTRRQAATSLMTVCLRRCPTCPCR